MITFYGFRLGKTRICQILSQIYKKKLHIINCHMNSEAADFLGSIRPTREISNSKKFFEWQDGPLIDALKNGDDFLIDEISLADDSVLERLNSLLETERSILVSENSINEHADIIYAHKEFRIFATMNPGGDFGKKELSAALRNRFLEIWCPSEDVLDEFEIIIDNSLTKEINETIRENINKIICTFLKWLRLQPFSYNMHISIRDLMRWTNFINTTVKTQSNTISLNPIIALIHGACLIFIDSFSNEACSFSDKREICMNYLFEIINELTNENFKSIYHEENKTFHSNSDLLKFGPFSISRNKDMETNDLNALKTNIFDLSKYYLYSPTTSTNIMRLLRCFIIDNPIMLEGR